MTTNLIFLGILVIVAASTAIAVRRVALARRNGIKDSFENSMNLKNRLSTDRGIVVGIGRLKIPEITDIGLNCNIPLLSFVVIKGGDNDYIATCIPMQMDGYGTSVPKACDDMARCVFDHLYENFKVPELRESAWNCLADSFMSNPRSNVLWDIYYTLQIELAKKNIDIDKDCHLLRELESLKERVTALENQLRGKDDFINALLNSLLVEKHKCGNYDVSGFVVDLEPVEEAACLVA